MKYLLTIILVFFISTVVTIAALITEDKGTVEGEDVLMSVNGHAISRQYLEAHNMYQGGLDDDQDSDSSLETIITRELLIQEAQRLGIDKEARFRSALKNYYEQSLITVLTDRISQSSTVKVTEQEINRYREGFGKLFTFTVSSSGKTQTKVGGETRSVLFGQLATPIAFLLYDLEPGQVAEQLDSNGNSVIVRLDQVKVSGDVSFPPPPLDRIRKILLKQKEERVITEWIRGLREKASVVMYDKEVKK